MALTKTRLLKHDFPVHGKRPNLFTKFLGRLQMNFAIGRLFWSATATRDRGLGGNSSKKTDQDLIDRLMLAIFATPVT